jgi:hypothetical protein
VKYLYIIHNSINEKKYVGVAVDPERRWDRHTAPSNNRCPALKAAMNKHGVANFNMEVLCWGADEAMDKLEVESIQLFNSQCPNGYNITLGGDGTCMVPWDDENNKLLGTIPDLAVSKLIGVSIDVVTSRRRGLGITSYKDAIRKHSEDYLHLIGTVSDEELSDIVGISSSTAFNWRKKHNIPPCNKIREHVSFPIEYTHLLGTCKDIELSKDLEIPTRVVTRYRRKLGIEGEVR